ncbi:hypothetical protein [Curtobacterium sp. MCPF17_052]|uniref:hypothetical protein n=1 Tax=Curtobacterium sp. MCPF17_052 TaxID=2175655 RepID=UPI0024DF8484|nr:hypothetical protein [Curtobacterium sp. MCPF17_052]WIB12806.1 hypothetical protein DEJ36_01675 [Curtobacterium sp. MCPF17_052]
MPTAELVELVHQAGEDGPSERAGAAHDDPVGGVEPDERTAARATDDDETVRCVVRHSTVVQVRVPRWAGTRDGLFAGIDGLAALVTGTRIGTGITIGTGRDDDHRRLTVVSSGPHREPDERAHRRRAAQGRHAAVRHDQRPGEDEDRHRHGDATCCTRFHVPPSQR